MKRANKSKSLPEKPHHFLSVKMPIGLYTELKHAAEADRRSVSQFLILFLQDCVDKSNLTMKEVR